MSWKIKNLFNTLSTNFTARKEFGSLFQRAMQQMLKLPTVNCANHLLPYAYVDNIKIDEVGAHRRVIDCLSQDNQEKIGRVGLGFSPNLFKKLIAAPMVYIDKDFVHIIFQRVIEQQFLINFSLVRIRSILLSMIPSKLIQRKINFTTSLMH